MITGQLYQLFSTIVQIKSQGDRYAEEERDQEKTLKVKTNLKPGVDTDFSAVLKGFVAATKDLLLWPWG